MAIFNNLAFFIFALSSFFAYDAKALTSHFTNDLDGWEPLNPWLRSSVDGLTEGNFYMRMPVGIILVKEVNL